MENIDIPATLMNARAILPFTDEYGGTSFNLLACKNVEIYAGYRTAVPTGVSLEIPPGYIGIITSEPHVSLNKSVDAISEIIDCNFRGEIVITVANFSKQRTHYIECGDTIAKLNIVKVPITTMTRVRLLNSVEGKG